METNKKDTCIWWLLSCKMPKLIIFKMLREAKFWYLEQCHLVNTEVFQFQWCCELRQLCYEAFLIFSPKYSFDNMNAYTLKRSDDEK